MAAIVEGAGAVETLAAQRARPTPRNAVAEAVVDPTPAVVPCLAPFGPTSPGQ